MVRVNVDLDLMDIYVGDLISELKKRNLSNENIEKLQNILKQDIKNTDRYLKIGTVCKRCVYINVSLIFEAYLSASIGNIGYARETLIKAMPQCFEDVIND